VVPALILALASSGLAWTQPVKQGPEFQVNTYTTSDQRRPIVSAGPSGGFVVVWSSDGQDGSEWGVFARRYDSGGNALDPTEFQVNTYTSLVQYASSVGIAPSGEFVVAWFSEGQDGWLSGIFARRYDGAGNALDPAEFQVNTYTAGGQYTPRIGIADSGDFVVVWSSEGQDGSFAGVFARRYDSVGNALDATEFQVNAHTQFPQQDPVVGVAASGDFVVAWQSWWQDGNGWGIFARRFDNAGNPLDPAEFQVNTHTTEGQYFPSIDITGSGDFVVAWQSRGQDGSELGTFARRYDSAGNPLDAVEFQVNTHIWHHQLTPSVAVADSGAFVVAWGAGGDQDGSSFGVFARRYDSSGNPLDPVEFQVNTYTTSFQYRPSVAMTGSDDFVVAWQSFDQDGSRLGIFGQRFCSDAAHDCVCDGLDDDGDGEVDEGCDDDGDAYCDLDMTVTGVPAVCPNGGGDCDDRNSTIHPGAADIPGDALDQDCDGARACDPAAPWSNHGQFVSCVARECSLLVSQGIVSHEECTQLVRAAARGPVGR
jgi:hypothetical protein